MKTDLEVFFDLVIKILVFPFKMIIKLFKKIFKRKEAKPAKEEFDKTEWEFFHGER